jgi:hypothetical protein
MQRMHRLGYRLLIGLLGAVVALGVAAPIPASAAPTQLTLSAKAAFAGQTTPLRIVLTDGVNPIPDAVVVVERRVGGVWTGVPVEPTDESGETSVPVELSKQTADNVFRASYAAGTPEEAQSGVVQVDLKPRKSKVTVSGPDSVKDEKSVELRVRWMTGSGEPVAGRVQLFRRNGRTGPWKLIRRLSTDVQGRASVTVTPRVDTWWRAKAKPQAWVRGDRSKVHAVDNIPPGDPVKLPKNAPNPRVHLPTQPDAVGDGANAVVTAIPNRVWGEMTGRTWHRGCPVGRSGLRYLKINYWDYSGYRRRGELVANADAVHQMAAALTEMYRKKLPIRAMYREDRFGWSRKLGGANDYRSMAAGNTSAFNCRGVVGNPSTRSPHSYGRSLDLNTWENPYRSAQGTVPNSWWMGHSHPRVAWRSRSHPVVRLMAAHGLRWTYGNGDTQHFDASGSGRTSARLNAEFLECAGICD